MSLNNKNKSAQDTDSSNSYTPPSSTETIPNFTSDDEDHDDPSGGGAYPISYTVPGPDSWIIRSASSRQILTFLKGQVVLAPPDSLGSQHWECIETDGWLGFRNVASYGFLGRDNKSWLCCSAMCHQESERFCIRGRSEGGHFLTMTYSGKLQPVGIKEEKGEKKLAMIENDSTDKIVWEFVKA
jgi:hypothetical protein